MKKILLLMLIAFLFCCQSVLADDNTLNQAPKSPTYVDGKGKNGSKATGRDVISHTNTDARGEKRAKGEALPGRDRTSLTDIGTGGKKTEQSFKDNKAVIAIQKQPATENFQKQSVKNNWFCVVVQINNGVKDSDNALQPAKQ